MDAFELGRPDERFDLVFCFGILHRVENPLGLLHALHGLTATGGTVLVETYGVRTEDRDEPAIRRSNPGEVYAHDEFVYWEFRGQRLPGGSDVPHERHVACLAYGREVGGADPRYAYPEASRD